MSSLTFAKEDVSPPQKAASSALSRMLSGAPQTPNPRLPLPVAVTRPRAQSANPRTSFLSDSNPKSGSSEPQAWLHTPTGSGTTDEETSGSAATVAADVPSVATPLSQLATMQEVVTRVLLSCQPKSEEKNDSSAVEQLAEECELCAAHKDGTLDDDFPPLDPSRSVHTFGLQCFLVKLRAGAAAPVNALSAFVPAQDAQIFLGERPAQQEPVGDPKIAMFRAAEGGEVETLHHLVQHCDVPATATGIDNWTALHFAARKGHLSVCNYLLKLDAPINIDAETKNKWTPLHLAAFQGHLEVVETLLTCGARPLISNKDGNTALDHARSQGHAEIVELLEDFVEEEKAMLRLQASSGFVPPAKRVVLEEHKEA